jgi:hypothetical protein
MTAPEGSLYGWRHTDLRAAAEQIAEALSIEFELRDSSFRGGDYYGWRGLGDEELFVQENFRDLQGELEWPEYAEYHVMLDVGGRLSDRAYEVLTALPGLDLLQVRRPLNSLPTDPQSDPSQGAT